MLYYYADGEGAKPADRRARGSTVLYNNNNDTRKL